MHILGRNSNVPACNVVYISSVFQSKDPMALGKDTGYRGYLFLFL